MNSSQQHQLSLFILELLLTNQPSMAIPIDQLYRKLTSPEINSELRGAFHNSMEGLRHFILRFPALFSIYGDVIVPTMCDDSNQLYSSYPLSSSSSLSATQQQQSFLLSQENSSLTSSSSSATTATTTASTVHSTTGLSSDSLTPMNHHLHHHHSHHHHNNSISSTNSAPLHDVSAEAEAVRYFQDLLCRRDERWVHVRSLAGHLSQASHNVRRVVGPQADFKHFLARHRHVFEIQGDLVGLTDSFFADLVSSASGKRRYDNNNKMSSLSSGLSLSSGGGNAIVSSSSNSNSRANSTANRPKSLNNSFRGRKNQMSNGTNNNNHNNNGDNNTTDGGGGRRSLNVSASSTPITSTAAAALSSSSSSSPPVISLTAMEYRAILFVRKLIESKGGKMSIIALTVGVMQSPEQIKSVVGWTQVEVVEFLRKHVTFFELLEKDRVHCLQLADNVTIMLSKISLATAGASVLHNGVGTVYHISKLWGIIDLGQHEHVFFDKSILKHVDDLQKHFEAGEILYFNAILAPKGSRARWRATQVWKQDDRDLAELMHIHATLSGGGGGVSASSLPPVSTYGATAAAATAHRRFSGNNHTIDQNGNENNNNDDNEDEDEEVEEIIDVQDVLTLDQDVYNITQNVLPNHSITAVGGGGGGVLGTGGSGGGGATHIMTDEECQNLLRMGQQCGHKVLFSGEQGNILPSLGNNMNGAMSGGGGSGNNNNHPFIPPPPPTSFVNNHHDIWYNGHRNIKETTASFMMDDDCSQGSEPSTMRSIPSISGDLGEDVLTSSETAGVFDNNGIIQRDNNVVVGGGGGEDGGGGGIVVNRVVKSTGTQTVSTGDIIPTNYFHESQ